MISSSLPPPPRPDRPAGRHLRRRLELVLDQLLDQLGLGPGRRIHCLQDFLPGPEGIDPHLLPLGLHDQALLLRLDRRGEPLPTVGPVAAPARSAGARCPLHRHLGHPTAHGTHRFQLGLSAGPGPQQLVWPQPTRRYGGGHQRGAETTIPP